MTETDRWQPNTIKMKPKMAFLQFGVTLLLAPTFAILQQMKNQQADIYKHPQDNRRFYATFKVINHESISNSILPVWVAELSRSSAKLFLTFHFSISMHHYGLGEKHTHTHTHTQPQINLQHGRNALTVGSATKRVCIFWKSERS